jgi:glutamate-ammonia-ligase adenylyltransferase
MDRLAAQLLEGLERQQADPELLARAGDPDPALAADALSRAHGDPDLARSATRWLPALLVSARPGFGAGCLADLAALVRERSGRPFDLARTPMLPLLVGSSNFLARCLLRHPDWLEDLAGDLPGPPESLELPADWEAIRRAKYRALLRVAARDLAGRPFAESLRELSDLADRCLDAALRCAAFESETSPPALLALGKLGGRELNFSSDVDLLFVHHPPEDTDPLEYTHAVARLIRDLKHGLEEPTADGFGYRVDLDLRPEGRAGVLANPVDAALTYYEAFGAEWERQMLIRLRLLTDSRDAGREFRESILPFVYRRLIDPGVLQSVRDMKARIEDERRRAGRDVESDVKEGPGGIRDVEFLVQSLQLFYGGRDPELRSGNVLDTLSVLGRRGLLPADTTSSLSSCYIWLRRVEHALQMAEEQQTARLPQKRTERTALARRMGYDESAGDAALARLLDDWTSVRSQVRSHFEALVLSGEA